MGKFDIGMMRRHEIRKEKQGRIGFVLDLLLDNMSSKTAATRITGGITTTMLTKLPLARTHSSVRLVLSVYILPLLPSRNSLD